MSVRRATPADIERLADLNLEVHDLHVAHLPWFFKPAQRAEVAAVFAEKLAVEDTLIFVASEDAEVVGYMVLVLRERPKNPLSFAQRWLYLEQIGVAATHRRRGHAAALVQAAREVAKEHGLDRIELDTYGWNERAQGFFRAQGFATHLIRMSMTV